MSIPLQYQLFFLMLDKFSNVKHCLIPKNILLNFQEKIILKINSEKNDTLTKLLLSQSKQLKSIKQQQLISFFYN